MFLFLLFFLHLHFLIALKEATHKCINCKFFLKPIPPFSLEFSKCNLYPKSTSNDKDNNLEQRKRKDLIDLLVNGYERKSEYCYFEIDYHYCSFARDSENMCGKEGNNFKKRL